MDELLTMVAMTLAFQKEVLSGVHNATLLTYSRGAKIAAGKVRTSREMARDELSSKGRPSPGGDETRPAKIGVDNKVLLAVQDHPYGSLFLVPDSTLIPAL